MMASELTVRHESIDDIPLLLQIIQEMGIAESVDRWVKPHGLWQGITVGTVVSIWLCYMLTTQDHRLVAVREWVQARTEMFNRLLGIELRETDCSDDRLAIVLSLLGKPRSQMILDEQLVGEWSRIYAMPRETIRLDSTTVNVYHHREEDADSLFQFGFNRHAHDEMRQFKVMMATLDPLGMPLTASVVGGEQGDDLLYVPTYKMAVNILDSVKVLVVGDSKMSSLAARGQIVEGGSRYLCPLNENSLVAEQRLRWIDDAIAHPDRWQSVYRPLETGAAPELLAVLVEYERLQQWQPTAGDPIEWTERIVLVRSASFRERLYKHLERRWQRVQVQLDKLRRPPGRGRRYYRSYEALWKAVLSILKEARLEEVVQVELTQQPLPHGKSRWIVDSYGLIDSVWQLYCARLGWRAFATNMDSFQMEGPAIVGLYRQQILHERTFSRLKTRHLNIHPIFLRDEQRLLGLTWLLEMALRILTLTEFRIRRTLAETASQIIGLNPAAPTQPTSRPTTERILAAFKHISLTLIDLDGQILRYVTPLTPTQRQILALLNLPPDLYTNLTLPAP
jgi:transposase